MWLQRLPARPLLSNRHYPAGRDRAGTRPAWNASGRMQRLKILIWHIHGSYLNSLARIEHDWYLPVKPGRPTGYVGRGWTFDWPDWVREVPAERVRDLDLDLVIFQTPQNY